MTKIDFNLYLNDMIRKLVSDVSSAYSMSYESRLHYPPRFEMLTTLLKGVIDMYGKEQLLPILSSPSMSEHIVSGTEIIEAYMNTPLFHEKKDKKDITIEFLDLFAYVRDNKKRVLYERRKEYYNSWSGNYVRHEEVDSVLSCFEYIIDNDDIEWKDFYDVIKVGQYQRYMSNYLIDRKHMEQELLAVKSPSDFEKQYPKTFKGMNKNFRSAYYCGVIAQGKADKKFIRRMRSETASEPSLRALNCFIKYKDKYDNFDSWIMQFNDSKHQAVVDRLVGFYDKKDVMHMLGNPLANKENIRRKLMS